MKEAIIFLVIGAILIASGFLLGQISVNPSGERVISLGGGNVGPNQYNKVQFYDQTTFSCARVYQLGATTNASTTYYLVASTTHGTLGEVQGFKVMATSTKPTNC